MSKPRVLLGDDHKLILEGLKTVLALDYDIVGVALDGRDLVSQAEKHRPDAVVLDISMPLLNGIEAARQIKQAVPNTKIVFITQTADRAYVQTAFRNGASAYVLKDSMVSDLVAALHQALSGYFYIPPALRKGMPDSELPIRVNPSELFGEGLTQRQREVLQLVAEGKANKEIANLLDVSIKTVEYHKANLMDELNLHTTAELTRYAIEHGFITLPAHRTTAG